MDRPWSMPVLFRQSLDWDLEDDLIVAVETIVLPVVQKHERQVSDNALLHLVEVEVDVVLVCHPRSLVLPLLCLLRSIRPNSAQYSCKLPQ